MTLMSLLVFVIIIALVFWALRTLAPALKIPEPIVTVIYVLLVIFSILFLLRAFGLLSSGPVISFQ